MSTLLECQYFLPDRSLRAVILWSRANNKGWVLDNYL